MPEKAATAQTQVKIRLREPLRARLEADAARLGYPLSTEIVRRIETAVRDEDLGRVVFGDERMFGFLDWLGRILRGIEEATGKSCWDDQATWDRATETIYRVMKHCPGITAPGEFPGSTRSAADRAALMVVESMVDKELQRKAKDAGAAPSRREGGRRDG